MKDDEVEFNWLIPNKGLGLKSLETMRYIDNLSHGLFPLVREDQ